MPLRGRKGGDVALGLTDSNCSHHRGHDDRQSHSAGDHQVPLVVGDVFALVAVVDLTEGGGEGEKRESESERETKLLFPLAQQS